MGKWYNTAPYPLYCFQKSNLESESPMKSMLFLRALMISSSTRHSNPKMIEILFWKMVSTFQNVDIFGYKIRYFLEYLRIHTEIRWEDRLRCAQNCWQCNTAYPQILPMPHRLKYCTNQAEHVCVGGPSLWNTGRRYELNSGFLIEKTWNLLYPKLRAFFKGLGFTPA